MSLLVSDLANKVYAAFKGRLLTGLIRQVSVPVSGGLDAHGDPIDSTATFTACQGFFDEYDDAYKMRAGIPHTDLKVCIFAQSIPGIVPGKDDKIMLRGRDGDVWYQVRKVKTDPAFALWETQSFTIPAPEDAP